MLILRWQSQVKQLVSIREGLIYASFLISFTNYVLYNTMLIDNLLKNGLRVTAIAFLASSFLFNRKLFTVNIKDIIVLVLLATTLVTLNFNSNLFNIGYIILVIIAAKNIDKNKFKTIIFRTTLIALMITFVLLFAGIIQDVKYTIDDRTRHTFGFVNPNAFSGLLFSTIIMYVLSKQKLEWFRITISVFVVLFFYLFTDSRTPTFAFLLFIGTYLFLYIFRKMNPILIKTGLVIMSIIPPVISFLSPILLDKYPVLDKILSLRLAINTTYIMSNEWINFLVGGTKAADIDNGFLTLSYSIGFFAFALAYMLIIKVLLLALKNRNYIIVAFILSFLFVNAFEAWFLRPEMAVTLFFWNMVYNYPKTN